MITKKELSESLSLSCVESYFLAWLSRNYNVSQLYGYTYIGLKQVLKDFSHGANYESYCYIPRLQDVAEEYGVVTHEYRVCSAEEAINLLHEQSEHGLYLIRVNTAFFSDFKRAAWRDDHYICVNSNLEWVNEYPLSSGQFSEERFMEVYDGAVCIFSPCDLTVEISDSRPMWDSEDDLEVNSIPRDLHELESAVGILRVSRKRLEQYYRTSVIVREILHEENKSLDKLYFNIRLRFIRSSKKETIDNVKLNSEFYNILMDVIEKEKLIAEEIKNERR